MRWSLVSARGRELLLQGLLLLVLLMALYPGFFFQGKLLTAADLLFLSRPWDLYAPPGWTHAQNRVMPDVITAFVPYYAASKMSLQAGEWPLWNPFELGGIPLLANAQSTVLYPPRLLHSIFDLHLATSLFIAFKVWLCGMTAYICARGLGLGTGASRFFGVGWMLASYNVVWAYWSLTDVSAWLPILFLGTEYVLNAQYRRGVFLTGLGGALLLLAGHPETAFTMAFGVGLYFLFRLIGERRWGALLWKQVGASCAGWALALGFSAGMLVPFAEYLLNSHTFFSRAHGETTTYMPFGSLVSLWVPRFFGTTFEENYWGNDAVGTSNPYMMIYTGIAVWLMVALLATPGEVRHKHRNRILGLLAASFVMMLLAYDAPGVEWVNRLPVFRSMITFYHVAFVVFALPLVGAIAYEHWFSQPRRVRDLGWLTPMIAFPAILAFTLYRFYGSYIGTVRLDGYIQTQLAIAAIFAVAGLSLLALYCSWHRPRVAGFLLTLLLAVDLLVGARGYSATVERRYVYPDTELTRYLQSLEKPVRIGMGEGGIVSGLGVPYGIQEILGYDGLYPARIIRFQETLGQEIWNAMQPTLSLAYLLHDPRYEPLFPLNDFPGRFEKVAVKDGIEVLRDKQSLPRAYLVPNVRVATDPDTMFEVMKRKDFDPVREVFVEKPLEGFSDSGDAAPDTQRAGVPAGDAHVTRYSFTRVEVELEAPRKSVLVLGDAFYPGWQATLDGKPTEVFPAHYVWRGVVVPEGRHTVQFTYEPASLKIGLAVSVMTCVGSLIYAAWSTPRRRRSLAA